MSVNTPVPAAVVFADVLEPVSNSSDLA